MTQNGASVLRRRVIKATTTHCAGIVKRTIVGTTTRGNTTPLSRIPGHNMHVDQSDGYSTAGYCYKRCILMSNECNNEFRVKLM